MEQQDLPTTLLILKAIRDKCTDKVMQYCLFESTHENNVLPIIRHYHLQRLEEVNRLDILVQHKNLDTYIKVLEKLTNTLITIFT
jgi:hypothetical protein